MFNNILKHIDLLESNKTTIINMWIDYDIVQKKLTQNTMNIDFFKEKFAVKVFDFATSVVRSDNEVGECPVIGVMLMLFKKKNIPLSDVFIICVNFKNAMLHFMHQQSLLDDNMISEISILMDYNFEGVISEYVNLYYNDSTKRIHCGTKEEKSLNKVQVSVPIILPIKESTSAQDYFNEVNFDMEMVDELDELEHDTLNVIDADENINQDSLSESANLFEQYAKVLNMMYEFEELAYTLTILKDLLSSTDIAAVDNETKYMVMIYLKAIISDLQSWRMSIFITKEAEDIHYLDKTLLSSIAQLQITLMPQEHAQEDEIEFF